MGKSSLQLQTPPNTTDEYAHPTKWLELVEPVLEVEPPGLPDRSELGLLGGVLGAGSEHSKLWARRRPGSAVNPAHLAVARRHVPVRQV